MSLFLSLCLSFFAHSIVSKASESTNKEIFAKLEEVKTMIKSEEEVRRAADEQFLATLNEYMRALKTGLKRVT